MLATDNLRYTKMPLNNGSGAIPALGFGTLIPDPVATRAATKAALEAGFRLLDTAERYRTEKEVGEAMQEVFKEGKVKREDVFVITKLWNTNHRPERVKPAFEASLKKLQLDYVDLYLIHTPFAFQPGDEQDPRDANGAVIYDKAVTLLDTWRALEGLVDEGKCKAIGLSDVSLEQAKGIFDAARIKPAVVHVESHPYLPEWDLLNYCKKNGIVLQAFAALGHSSEPRLLEDPVITAIARRVNKTPAQVLLAWAIQRGTALLTTSKTPSRIKENFDVSAIPEDAVREIMGLASRLLDLLRGRADGAGQLRVRDLRLRGDDHVRPVAGRPQTDGLPDAAAGAGDEERLSLERGHRAQTSVNGVRPSEDHSEPLARPPESSRTPPLAHAPTAERPSRCNPVTSQAVR